MTARLLGCLACVVLAQGCGPSDGGGGGGGGGGKVDLAGAGGNSDGGSDDQGVADAALDDAAARPDLTATGFDVQPAALQTLTVGAGMTPTVTYAATLNGQPIAAAWSLDRGNLGTVQIGPSPTSTFTPKGTVGGLVNITASLNGMTLTRQVMVQLRASQNGSTGSSAEQAQVATSIAQLTAGGGVGGVGGEGLGGPVDSATQTALANPSSDGKAQGLAFLYPYDKTVWPRGLLAPLLMWSWSLGDADGIKIELSTTSGAFSWSGTFGRPAILSQTNGAFVRHPIPEDVWDMATATAGAVTAAGTRDKLTVKLTVEKGGQAYGPISETWSVAPARLSGIIYYNSYGTQLAKNFSGAVGGDGMFGGAVLSIHVGDTAPKLTAGTNGTSAQCRVCHSVAAFGQRLVVQHGDTTSMSSAYDLSPAGATETVLSNGATYPGVYPDGSKMLTEAGALYPLPNDSSPIATTGLTSFSTDLGTPTFSPSGTQIAFNPLKGPANAAQTLYSMTFDPVNNVFTKPVLIVDDSAQPAETRPGWPAFLPDGKSVVFHQQSKAGADGNTSGALWTRKGSKAQIAWTSAADATHVTALNQLNGKDASGNVYLPKLAQPITLTCTGDGVSVGGIDPDHGDDVDTNYEPTVNPVPSGGFVWVVFTSRRLYGNEAVIPPFCSDPRGVDLIKNITTKKLWVAAIDLSAPPGADASHPAFYLPGQELLAGNSRGFWVLDPCKADGQSCDTGDQCCNGYCEPNGAGGALICSSTPPTAHCSMEQEKCTTPADCCNSNDLCVNGFCSAPFIP